MERSARSVAASEQQRKKSSTVQGQQSVQKAELVGEEQKKEPKTLCRRKCETDGRRLGAFGRRGADGYIYKPVPRRTCWTQGVLGSDDDGRGQPKILANFIFVVSDS